MIRLQDKTLQRLRDNLHQEGARPSVVVSSASDILAKTGLLPPEEQAAVQMVWPIVEVMFLMMASDGELGGDEQIIVRGAVRKLTDNYVRSATLDVLLSVFRERWTEVGTDAMLKEAAGQFAGDRLGAETAFVLAAAVAFSDEAIDDRENVFLNEFAASVGLDEGRANELLDELEKDLTE